jgi:hypothetical protein
VTPVDLVDLLLQLLPRNVSRVLILIVVAVFGSQAVTWYAEQNATVVKQAIAPVLERLASRAGTVPTDMTDSTVSGDP